MNRRYLETIVGFAIVIGAILFLSYAYKVAGMHTNDKAGYIIKANFERADGLQTGSDVRIAGIKVGQVVQATLDPKDFKAQIFMHIDASISIPADSSAQIVSDGLLGAKYMAIVPGSDENKLPAGGEVQFTQSSVNLESLIGQMIFSKDSSSSSSATSQAPASAPAPNVTVTPPVALPAENAPAAATSAHQG